MRTLVDIPEDDLRALGDIAEARGLSRAAVLREAVDAYLAQQRPRRRDDAFGAWGTGEDGLAYQQRMREEW